MRQYDHWDIRFLDMAKFVAAWSKDPSTKAGAVITTGKRIISVGFNGLAQAVEDTEQRLSLRNIKYEMIIHAEINALLFAQRSVAGCTLYTWPIPPCSRCAAVVIQAGIKRVLSPHPSEHWNASCAMGLDMFTEAGVEARWVGDDKSV